MSPTRPVIRMEALAHVRSLQKTLMTPEQPADSVEQCLKRLAIKCREEGGQRGGTGSS